ncbi:hypothetical protein IR010_10055 [Flavobacterium sp. MR2016-29]|uniref:glycosyltransferase n=1 Tax=Flavobacterium sp. MR2016-29 TaxID=2783795 RepID=UPI00188A4CF0|nr:glycosyltransferase [Flavobacterium sp. MR2016-29]MBF4492883.1 hypothetical protein [Flavobacterium sp. MR2016-29]
MISVIVCSRNQNLKNSFIENIKNSIGCEFELIIIDNSKNDYSIFEAYNLGIQKSIFKFLCFIHDDIFIHTENWGNVLIDIFNRDQKIGLVGVAGAKVKTKMPSPWWNCAQNNRVVNILQSYPEKDSEKMLSGFDPGSDAEVVVIDGVFMAARKIDKILFDSSSKGFHNYDLNISFEYKKYNYKIIVTDQIFIEHYSTGKLSREWVISTYKIHKKYKNVLPLQCQSSIVNKENEVLNAVNFIEESILYKAYIISFLTWCQLFFLQNNLKWHIKFFKRIFFKT